MALLNEAYCAHCGKKTNPLSRVKLSDGNYLCKACAGKAPIEVSEKVKGGTYQEFVQYLNCKAESEALGKIFKATHSYGEVALDTQNDIICLSSYGGLRYQRIANLEDFSLDFRAESFNDNIFHPRVKGDVWAVYQLKNPKIENSTIVKFGAKAKAKKEYGILKDKVHFINPDGVDEFILVLAEAAAKYNA